MTRDMFDWEDKAIKSEDIDLVLSTEELPEPIRKRLVEKLLKLFGKQKLTDREQ
jgi:hypothetical protein